MNTGAKKTTHRKKFVAPKLTRFGKLEQITMSTYRQELQGHSTFEGTLNGDTGNVGFNNNP